MQLTRSLLRARRIAPNRIATIYGARQQSWAQLEQRVAHLAGALVALGLRVEDRVAILGHSSDRFLESLYATLWAGGIVAPLSTRATHDELSFLLENTGSTILFVGDGFEHEALLWKNTDKGPVIYMGDGPCPADFIDYERLLASSDPMADVRRRGDDVAALFYTGGTTGQPKGVMLTHTNLHSNAVNGVVHLGLREGIINLHAGPLYHLAAASRIFTASLIAATHVIIPRFTPEAVFEAIERHRVFVVSMVPTMMALLLHHPDITKHDLSSLRLMTYGASPMPEPLIVELMQKLPHVSFAQAYGMTELSPACTYLEARDHTLDPARKHVLRSAGRPAVGIDIRIVDADDNEVPLGEAGEVTAAGPIVMKGYWGHPEATAEALRGGYMHTGDIGRMDTEGYLYIVDRLKDVIVSGGENVSSIEVENVIAAHPAVRTCAVIGIPHELWGEAVHAEVVLREGVQVSADEIIAFVHARIAGFKVPRSIGFRDEMPLSGANKILKSELRKPFWAGRSRAVN